MNNYDIAKLKNMKPVHAEGRPCIMLTDPLTGKVKEKIEGKNHVFTESMLSGYGYDWVQSVSQSYLCLTDSTEDIDAEVPYLLGQVQAYGIPSSGSKGLYQGAYSVTNQVLAKCGLGKINWKFQYDFTTSQANATFGTIGLTQQHDNGQKKMLSGYRVPSKYGTAYACLTCDGRYNYAITTAGIITKYDIWLGTSTTIDVSAITGTTGMVLTVGYAPDTERYYIYRYHSTAANIRMFMFSDSSFSTLLNTYSPSNLQLGSAFPMYVYNSVAYFFTLSKDYYYADFVNNGVLNSYTFPSTAKCNIAGTNIGVESIGAGMCPLKGTRIITGMGNMGYSQQIIFDLATNAIVGYVFQTGNSSGNAPFVACKYPISTERIVCVPFNTTDTYVSAAISAYKLPTPVTKTVANGMTVTYELEVTF